MLASLDDPPLTQHGFVYEPKYDGIRALVDVRPSSKKGQPAHVAMFSRNGIDKQAQFPAIVEALRKLATTLDGPVLLDAEVVAVDDQRTPLGFGAIQGRIHLTAPSDIAKAESVQPAVLVVFDILRDGDEDLRGLPMAARRLRLQERVRPRGAVAKWIRLSEIVADDGRKLLARAKRERWEGLIVKDGNSVYQSGRRTPAWRKLKITSQQEFVVVGWTDPQQSRQHFGALLLAVNEDDRLRYVGSVGTGFNQAELERVAGLLARRARTNAPVDPVPGALRRAHWVTPSLVAEVRFTEWTSDGYLRHPVYLGLREDKAAGDVVREQRAAAPKPRARPAARGRKTSPRSVSPAVKTARPRELDAVVDRLSSLEDARRDGEVELPNGDRLRITNPAKVFWPELGITKGELLRYYVEVSPYLLPAVDDRPLVMKRFPNGIHRQAFYQQRHPEKVPPGVRRERLPDDIDPIEEAEGGQERLIGGSLTTLLYMTQLAAISQDPWFSRVADPLSQDYTAIDLDPGEGATFAHVLDVARWVKDELDRLEIPAVPKTSGSRGLHIYIPLPPGTPYDVGQLFSFLVDAVATEKHPRVATIERWVRKRPRGTVYVDYLQNILGKTLATAYSARASDFAGVSTPLTWDEVAHGVDPREFTIRAAPARFREVGDLWAPLRTGKPVDLERVLHRARR